MHPSQLNSYHLHPAAEYSSHWSLSFIAPLWSEAGACQTSLCKRERVTKKQPYSIRHDVHEQVIQVSKHVTDDASTIKSRQSKSHKICVNLQPFRPANIAKVLADQCLLLAKTIIQSSRITAAKLLAPSMMSHDELYGDWWLFGERERWCTL